MGKISTIVLAAAVAVSSTMACAQGAGNTSGSIYSGSFNSVTVPNFGVGGTPSTTPGLGNGSNPGIGDRSDPSIRANPGLDANGPCNGARSTSGNNTPSC